MGLLIALGVIVVLALLAALVTDLRDRGRGGVRKVRMPRWLERRSRGLLMQSPINWDTSDDRLKSPREREESEHGRRNR
ncbi:hypothetical protein FNH05_07445 [Amycolatopsis rhizosphaerae]|uniref:Uncharacterized protein n=1 Tax=Amycolatopsis rhizosphaerae TaxID=2053003 RepID=A0A558D8W6_9PSEU|nr:hypothetical protein [Amycolatopsis rhizosphaerae]TVT57403.1 hypothetical protein FNH05_07445 [Amycolatopsis rhizosphaerae]